MPDNQKRTKKEAKTIGLIMIFISLIGIYDSWATWGFNQTLLSGVFSLLFTIFVLYKFYIGRKWARTLLFIYSGYMGVKLLLPGYFFMDMMMLVLGGIYLAICIYLLFIKPRPKMPTEEEIVST